MKKTEKKEKTQRDILTKLVHYYFEGEREEIKMIISLITKECMESFSLPEKVTGQYWVTNPKTGKKIISIEGIEGHWIMHSNHAVSVINSEKQKVKDVLLNPLTIYNLRNESGKVSYIFTEPITEERQIFKKYLMQGNGQIRIGRTESNDIMLNNGFVSGNHARLVYTDSKWEIYDEGSSNGTFVNGKRIKHTELNVGDNIYIMGFKIIIGSSFIAFNNPDQQVNIRTGLLRGFRNQEIQEEDGEDEYELPEVNYFYRSPRFKREVEEAVFKIDPPPQNAIGEEMPLMLVIGPSLTMGMASMSTAVFAVNNAMTSGDISAALPSIVMSMSMVLGTVLWPILSKRYDKKRRYKKEAQRQKKYREYLDKVAVKFGEESAKQEEILRENFVPLEDCVQRIENVQRNLWERGLGQNDFLKIRMGSGNALLSANVSYPERKFSVDDDNLLEELYTLCERPKTLSNVPITLSLYEDYVSGIVGDREQVKEFAKGMIFQIAALYSYDEVKMVFLYDEDEEEDFGFAKWLPHVWSNEQTVRFLATNPNEVKEVSAYIEKELEGREELNEENMKYVTPYYVIFVLSKELAARAEMLKQVYAKKENKHISIITFYDELKNLPKECTKVVDLQTNAGKIFDKDDISGKAVPFMPDIFLKADAKELSVRLANVPLDTLANSYKLPSMITFLQLFGVGKVEHLNALTRWKENDPTQSLEAEVGIDALGELFKLDLHEKFHGPHGLVAGMTGSGKSEFIITYILSLAVNYHPDEVAFILIDYKGGGMAKSFENLPHTAGIITNLDGAAIKRSLISIESELKRRQAIFAEASKAIGVSNIDIYKYQKLYREGKVNEPLQHLFIISDEFAELKTQQPEFMEQLVSAARIGRSLGVHLILATQKPSGVVDDQIWSNSKFRVCLKVQERADSMDMLKRPDAAELTDTGRFYLQVGYNELFEIGQSAWAGASYYPSDRVLIEKDDSVAVIDRNGHIIREVKPNKRGTQFANAQKQLDAITEYLGKIATEENIKIRPLWLEPIAGDILLNDVKEKYQSEVTEKYVLNPIIGEYDDPRRQRQCALHLPLSEEGNTVIYGSADSGKTTFVNALTYSLLQEHTADELNMYLLDFASETLRAFADAPQVGDVIFGHEAEKVSNLFKMLQTEVEKRKKLFADYGGTYSSYLETVKNEQATEILPSIVVVIHNFTALTEMYEEKEDAVAFLSREGTKYGIYFVLTALSTSAVRFRLLQNFKKLLTLQLNDETDYSTVVGKTEGMVPSAYKGRGLVKMDELYEFQIAHLTKDAVPYMFIQKECQKLRDEWQGKRARKIPILPEQVDLDFLSEYVTKPQSLRIPVGVEKSTLDVHYYPFDESYIHMVLAESNEYRSFVGELSTLMSRKSALDVSVLDATRIYELEENENLLYAASTHQCEEEINVLFDLVLNRNNTYKEAIEQGIPTPEFETKIIVIQSLVAILSAISGPAQEKLKLILEKGTQKYNVFVIIGEAIKNISSISFDKWYQIHINQGDGFWIGNGFSEQYQMKANKVTSEMREEMSSKFAYVLRKGKATKVKILSENKEEDENDE